MAEVAGQMILTPASDDFVHRVEWRGDVAATWRPSDDPGSPVRIDPERRFRRPAIDGISTESLWELSEEGEYLEDTAEAFDLSLNDVRLAIAYENAHRAA